MYACEARLFFEDEHRTAYSIQALEFYEREDTINKYRIQEVVGLCLCRAEYWRKPSLFNVSFEQDIFSKSLRCIRERGKDVTCIIGCRWATAHHLRPEEIPEGLEILKLPLYRPDLQPVERIWKIVNKSISNRCNAKWDVMVERMSERRKWMMEYGVDLIRRVTSFY